MSDSKIEPIPPQGEEKIRPVKRNLRKEEKQDPNKPLKNLKHEKLARKIALDPKITQTEAYLEVYPTNNHLTAKSEASDILSKPNVRERVLALMSQAANKDILKKVAEKLDHHTDSATETISMDACKTVLKVAGAMDEQRIAETSYNPTQINIVIRSNSNDDKEIYVK